MIDVKRNILFLLDFIEESLQEAVRNPHTLQDCLTEASTTLKMLNRHIKNDELLEAYFSLTPLGSFRFSNISELKTNAEKLQSLKRDIEFVSSTKGLISAFNSPRHPNDDELPDRN